MTNILENQADDSLGVCPECFKHYEGATPIPARGYDGDRAFLACPMHQVWWGCGEIRWPDNTVLMGAAELAGMTFIMPRFPRAREMANAEIARSAGASGYRATNALCWQCGAAGFQPTLPCRACSWTIGDDERGLVWWACMTEAQRDQALIAAGTNVPRKAWEFWKATR